MAVLVTIGGMGIAILTIPRWILPPPLYFEITVWPLYALFASVALRHIGKFIAAGLRNIKLNVSVGARTDWLLPIPAIVLSSLLTWCLPPSPSGYPFPPVPTQNLDI